MKNDLAKLAELIRTRNRVAREIAALTGRPTLIGHLGEFTAARIFDIGLAESASSKTIDGGFRSGPLAGRSVNIKWYAQREGLLDITPRDLPDYYLVLSGPKATAASSRGTTRPWVIEAVYLFEAKELMDALTQRGVRIGVATSVINAFWEKAEVYPSARSKMLVLSDDQRKLLGLFSSSEMR